jgi:hypothetical protein
MNRYSFDNIATSNSTSKKTSSRKALKVISGFACAITILAAGAANATQKPVSSANLEEFRKEARGHAKSLGGALKARLQQAIKHGGLEAGVEECKLVAEPIAESLSNEGWTVGRTALRVRNPNNTPDSWEQTQLANFAEQLSQKLPGPFEALHVDEQTGELRYMKAIQTGQVCTACHGNNIAPDVYHAIKKAYPNDEAIGFDVGSLRGAFSLTYSPSMPQAD